MEILTTIVLVGLDRSPALVVDYQPSCIKQLARASDVWHISTNQRDGIEMVEVANDMPSMVCLLTWPPDKVAMMGMKNPMASDW